MSHAISSSLEIPCLGTSKPYYSGDRERNSALFNIASKVCFVISAVLAVIGLALLSVLPPVGGAFLATACLGFLSIMLFSLVGNIRTPDSNLEKIEKLEAAKQLAVGIEIPPALQQELEQVIPAIDAIGEDDRIASIHYNCNETATFTLKAAPDLQFRVSPAAPKSSLGNHEFHLAHRYENMVYAQAICQAEGYDALVIPPTKPIYLKVDGLRRSILVEKLPQRDASGASLEQAVRQMVRFLLKTGGNNIHDPIPFVPVAGGKLALQNLYHLTGTPHLDVSTRAYLEDSSVIDKNNSLLAALEREDLIDIALDEFQKLRPAHPKQERCKLTAEKNAEIRLKQIQKAKETRLKAIHDAVQVSVQSGPAASPPNILGVSPEDLGLDLGLKDYAVIRRDGIYSDGICRTITLGEVAQAVIDCINRKLANPRTADIEFTAEEMLIGEKLPSFTWEKHYQYNMLQGLGYREWPDPNKEPSYWMTLVLQSLKSKGVITDFSAPWRERPRVQLNLAALD